MNTIYNIIWRFCFAVSCILSLIFMAESISRQPTTAASYKIYSTNIGDRLNLVGDCKKEDAQKFFTYTTSNDRSVLTSLCFAAHAFKGENGKEAMLVPFKTNEKNDYWWGNTPYSTEVMEYTQKMADLFKMTELEESVIEGKYWEAKWSYIAQVTGGVIAGNAIFWALFYIMVWVFVGFKKKEHQKYGE
jgi:hypothetical protein